MTDDDRARTGLGETPVADDVLTVSRGHPASPSSTRGTSATLTTGAIVSSACLALALALQLLGRPLDATGGAFDVRAVIAAAADLRPWGWATLGVYAVIMTPAIGLFVTAFESRGRRESLLALAVVGILAVSLAIALVR